MLCRRKYTLTSHTGRYLDVITENKKVSFKNKVHVPITNKAKAHFRSSYTNETDVVKRKTAATTKTWRVPLSFLKCSESQHLYLVK